jgi:hypothetical protein
VSVLSRISRSFRPVAHVFVFNRLELTCISRRWVPSFNN